MDDIHFLAYDFINNRWDLVYVGMYGEGVFNLSY